MKMLTSPFSLFCVIIVPVMCVGGRVFKGFPRIILG